MYLVDTNVISEIRKGSRGDRGVVEFLRQQDNEIFLPVQVIGELRRGIENLRQKGDLPQAALIEVWFEAILEEFALRVLAFDADCAHKWGMLTGPTEQRVTDKQIAAIALIYGLTVVTRNTTHFVDTGVQLLNPFTGND